MSLLGEILTWTTTELTTWQRDAVRRLFQQLELTSQDLDDLYAMLKADHGLADPQARQPVPLTQEHLPAGPNAGAPPAVLLAIRDLNNVNRIAAGQKLEFSPRGITIIYGGNGSGKSGYSRVLKRACRARDCSETVYPDALDAAAAVRTPEAVFDVAVDGKPLSLSWKRDQASPEELATIAVFDGRCARAYLDAEQEVAYLPYGLDILEALGRTVLPNLSARLDAEIQSISTDRLPFADLAGDTQIGKMISLLSANTDPRTVAALATPTPEETARLADLDKALADTDPKAKARALRLSAQRVDVLIARIRDALKWVDDTALVALRSCESNAQTASKAEAMAAQRFQSGESLLPGTGEQAWKALFEAAERFSVEVVYPGEPFPHIGANARCPLCQRTLDAEAVTRMQRFAEYVKHDTAKAASEKRRLLSTAEQDLAQAVLDFGLDPAMLEEIDQLDGSARTVTNAFEKTIESRRTRMLAALKDQAWDAVPAVAGDPRLFLGSISTRLNAQATDLDKVANEEQRQALERERAELRARAHLSQRLQPVLDLIERLRTVARLMKCKNDLKTRSISDKTREFAGKAVTEALRNALNAEFHSLGVQHIRTKLNQRVEHGKMKHKLVLDLPVTRRLDEILSEGEQRIIAIGSFLAELHLAGHQGGIVFDDPVSSLDHHWRRNVARRLVAEAGKRQVIVLTHDTAFLGELCDSIEQQGVDHLVCHLGWIGDRPGHVNPGLPWEHQSFKERLDRLEKAQKLLEKDWPTYPDESLRDAMRRQYDRLRATIERVIQDVVFNGVIKRYRDWVRVDSLDDVVGFTTVECERISHLHKRCCQVVTAHDPSSSKNASVPTPKELKEDIADLHGVVDSIRIRRKAGAGVALAAAPS